MFWNPKSKEKQADQYTGNPNINFVNSGNRYQENTKTE